MRRLILIMSLALLLAACSGSGSDTTTTAETTTLAPTTTTTVAPTTTTTTTTTTTVAPTTTATTTTTTEAPAEDLAFEPAAGTPPDVFDSFVATMSITMESTDLNVEATAEGTWTTDAFQCTLSSGMGGLTFSESVIGTPQTLWYDQGSGYEESNLLDEGPQNIMSSCPTSPVFWTSFTTDELGNITGDETTYNGRDAYKADLRDMMDALGGLGLSEFEGGDISEMTVWIDVETNAIIGLEAQIAMPAELLGGASGDSINLNMQFSLDQFNDPSLTIDLP
jgi:hypothetical protein